MKYSLGISNFLEENSSLSHSYFPLFLCIDHREKLSYVSLHSNAHIFPFPAGVQPRWIQGIRSGDGVGDLFNYLFIKDIKSNRIRIAQ